MNRLFLCAWLLAGSVSVPSQQPGIVPSPDLAGIAHVALRVQNLDASIAFYEKLGFVRAFALSRDGAVYEAFLKINDRQFLELYPATARDPQTGFLHLCFEGKNLQAVHDYYVTKGLSPTDVRTAGAGNLLFTMHGPMSPTGAQNMEYTQYMPGSLHSKDVGNHLGPDRIATHMVAVTVAVNDPAAAIAFYAGIGFTAKQDRAQTVLRLPTVADESIVIVPDQPLGFKARIMFHAVGPEPATELQIRKIPFTREQQDLLVLDPDGNQIVFAPSGKKRKTP